MPTRVLSTRNEEMCMTIWNSNDYVFLSWFSLKFGKTSGDVQTRSLSGWRWFPVGCLTKNYTYFSSIFLFYYYFKKFIVFIIIINIIILFISISISFKNKLIYHMINSLNLYVKATKNHNLYSN